MGELVDYPSNGRSARGYLSMPESGAGPGVVVIQEWWGLVGHIKSVADRFAASGYVALAPDLYHGEATKSPDEAGKLMMALDIGRAERDLRGGVDFLASKSSGNKVGVVGFCMGGQLALFAASKNDRIGACVDFYGIHPNVKPDFTQIQAPVLGLFAEKDAFVNAEAVNALEKALREARVTADFHTYPGVDHAFFNDEREVYDRKAAEDAWKRVLAFFKAHLSS
ncbi:MAG TPA: dienelactone hydrolase family protein [Vicinamibacteria bacterium]|nr:dienelactone hydrolase family protein [Vicinamibacteria bacterium]